MDETLQGRVGRGGGESEGRKWRKVEVNTLARRKWESRKKGKVEKGKKGGWSREKREGGEGKKGGWANGKKAGWRRETRVGGEGKKGRVEKGKKGGWRKEKREVE